MTKIALILAIAAVGEGAVALHLVNQLHKERESTQALQARVTELESKAPQPGASATFIAVPQPTVSPFSGQKVEVPPTPATAGGRTVASATAPVPGVFVPPPPDRERMLQQMEASMERQRAMLRDPDYREAMLAQQKMGLMRGNPNVGRDLDLTAEQVDRLFTTLAEQQLLEIRRALGDAKFREWQEYQSMAGVRWEADRVRTSLASAGLPLDENLTKPLMKTLAEQQQKMMQEATRQMAPAANRVVAVSGGLSSMVTSDGTQVNALQMQEKSLEFMAQHQKRQREALARVLTPEQLKIVEDEHNAELQMQKAQLRMMRAQQEAGLLDPAGNNIGYTQDSASANFVPATSD